MIESEKNSNGLSSELDGDDLMPVAATMWNDAITEDVHGLRQHLASKKSGEGSILSRTNIGRHGLIHHGHKKPL